MSCSVEEDGIYTVIDEGGTDVGNYAVRFEFGENKENNFVWFYNGSEVNGATMTLNFAITIVKAENNPVTLEKPDGWTYGDEAETLEADAAFGTPVLYYATDENGAYGTCGHLLVESGRFRNDQLRRFGIRGIRIYDFRA